MRAIASLVGQLLSAACLLPAERMVVSAEKIIIHEIQEAQEQYHERDHATSTPFLSATLKTELFPVAGAISSSQKELLSASLVTFLQRIFDDQQVYDVEIVGAAIFEEQILASTEEEEGGQDRGRRGLQQNEGKGEKEAGRVLTLNSLQEGQFHFRGGDDDEDRGRRRRLLHHREKGIKKEKADRRLTLNSLQEGQFHFRSDTDFDDSNANENKGTNNDDAGEWDELKSLVEHESGHTLRFATVVSAEHKTDQSLSHSDFQTMLIHVCHKFESHLVAFVNKIDDEYFENVKAVVVSGYEEVDQGPQRQHMTFEPRDYTGTVPETAVKSESEGMSTGSIVAIVLGCLLLISLAFALVRLYKREQRLKRTNRWRSLEITTANDASPAVKSLQVLYNKTTRADDDYSFDPLGTDNGYNGDAIPRYSDRREPLARQDHRSAGDDTVPFGAASASPLVHLQSRDTEGAPGRTTSSTESSPLSLGEEQHVFAPPGKVGVAIDVLDGHPIVHKVKRGSPLEGLLRPNDRVVAIDDTDTTSMSAADVTHLMVKRMNYQRKITFVRRDDARGIQ